MSKDLAIARDMEKGWILEDGNRLVTFRVKTFQAFVDRLSSLVGSRVSEVIMYQMGTEVGHVAYKYSEKEVRSEEDIVRVLDSVLAARGWGRCEGFENQTQGKIVTCTLKVSGTPLSHERTSQEPTCNIVRGIVAGFLESHYGGKAQTSTEKECASTGSKTCIFEVAFQRSPR